MKGFFFVLIAVFALTGAEEEIDWSKVIHRTIDVPAVSYEDPSISNTIVGGEEVTPNTLPYQVALFLTGSAGTFFCGGSLISTRYVLTAAHCLDDIQSVQVILGAHNIRLNETNQQRLTTDSSSFRVHNDWNRALIRNDIATISLPTPATLNDNVQLINLPRRADIPNSLAGITARASGWGRPSDDSNAISNVLRSVELPVISNLVCRLSFPFIVQNSNICTSGNGGRGTCNGDSGGPLVVNGIQVGIVSFGNGQCERGSPAAYARITSFLNWIQENSDVVIS